MNKYRLQKSCRGALLAAFSVLSSVALAQSADADTSASDNATARIRRSPLPTAEVGTIPAARPGEFVPSEAPMAQPQGFVGSPATERALPTSPDTRPSIWETQPGNTVTTPGGEAAGTPQQPQPQ